MLAINLDSIKTVNDTWGHPAGDAVLRAAAKVMTETLRPTDRLFRIGGEEFCVILPNAPIRDARDVAERMRGAIAATPVPYKGAVIDITISIGIAGLGDAASPSGVLAAADSALYRAKDGGRNSDMIDGHDTPVGLTAA